MPSQTKNQTKPKVAVPETPASSPVHVPAKQTAGKNMKGDNKNVAPVAPVVPVAPAKKMRGGKKNAEAPEVPVEQVAPVVPEVPVAPVAPVEPVAPVLQEGGKKKQVRKAKSEKPKNAKVQKVAKGGKTDDEKEEESCDKRMRSFKVRLPGDEDFCGRFTGLTPYQAANKALSKFYRDNKQTSVSMVTFTIKESTRGSKRSEYVYNGKREKLAEPVKYPIQNKDGEVTTITKSFKNKLTKVKKAELTAQNAAA